MSTIATYAIARSISHNEIVRLAYDAEALAALKSASEDNVLANGVVDCWGTTPEGQEWRVEMSASAPTVAIRLTLSDDVSSYGPDVDDAQMYTLQQAIVAELERRGHDVERSSDAADDSWLVRGADGDWSDDAELRNDVYAVVCG